MDLDMEQEREEGEGCHLEMGLVLEDMEQVV
jgi:hypothetical protein